MSNIPENVKSHLIKLAKYYRGYQNIHSSIVTVGYHGRIFSVDTVTEDIDEIRSKYVDHIFNGPSNLSHDDLRDITNLWNDSRISMNESRFVQLVVPYQGDYYLVDGSWRMIYRHNTPNI